MSVELDHTLPEMMQAVVCYGPEDYRPVSYTHLTLPTIYSV